MPLNIFEDMADFMAKVNNQVRELGMAHQEEVKSLNGRISELEAKLNTVREPDKKPDLKEVK